MDFKTFREFYFPPYSQNQTLSDLRNPSCPINFEVDCYLNCSLCQCDSSTLLVSELFDDLGGEKWMH